MSTSVSAGGIDAKPYATAGQIRAVADHCARAGLNVAVKQGATGDLQLVWKKDSQRSCSVILVSDDPADLSEMAGEFLDSAAGWPGLEVVYPGSQPAGRAGLRAVRVPPGADLLDRIRLLVREAAGNVLIFSTRRRVPDPAIG